MLAKQKQKLWNTIRFSPFGIQRFLFSISHKRELERWKKAGKPLPPPRLVKENIIEKYTDITGYKILVETGTYLGDMVFAQIRNFDKIYSIELDHGLWEKAKRRFRKYAHVFLFQGDSGKVLKQVLDEIMEPAIFWLDGHYSGGITAMGSKVTPIFEELAVIFNKNLKHVILIDDERLFTGQDGYPAIGELKTYIYNIRPNCEITSSNDCIQVVLK